MTLGYNKKLVTELYTAEVIRRELMKKTIIENEFHCLRCSHQIRTPWKFYGEKCPRCAYPVMIKANLCEKVGKK